MKEQILALRHDGYDPFIDFLKGLSILFIVFTHCFPDWLSSASFFCVWGTSAVPFFLILQVFHSFKKGLSNTSLDIHRVWTRVIRPFLVVQVVIVLILFCLDHSVLDNLLNSLYWGGYGPGSYYPWIYVEFAIILPISSFFVRLLKGRHLLWWFILVSQLLEVVCSMIDMPLWLYRLCFFRYFFLVYLGYHLVNYGIKINARTIVVSFVSLGCLLFFYYSGINLRPVFFTGLDGYWSVFHWVCYFYMAYLLFFVIHKCYCFLQKSQSFLSFIKKMGRYSYEIFLFQLFYFSVFSSTIEKLTSKIGCIYICDLCYVIISSIICVVPVVLVKEYLRSR